MVCMVKNTAEITLSVKPSPTLSVEDLAKFVADSNGKPDERLAQLIRDAGNKPTKAKRKGGKA